MLMDLQDRDNVNIPLYEQTNQRNRNRNSDLDWETAYEKYPAEGFLPQGIFFFCVNLMLMRDRPLGLIRAPLDFYDVYAYGYAVLFAVIDDKSRSA